MLRTITVAVGIAATAAALHSQQPPSAGRAPEQEGSFRFRSGVELINVTTTVFDMNGRFVAGLRQEDFLLYEDERLQAVTHFSAERVPVSLGIALDTSQSMSGEKIHEARTVIDRLLEALADPQDEFFLYRFSTRPMLIQEWTAERSAIGRALTNVTPAGQTAMHYAITEAIPLAQQGWNQKKALVVISDGNDTSSRHTLDDARRRIRESETLVYAIGVDCDGPTLTDDSGGRTEIIRDPHDLNPATTRVADELSQQYYLGYPASGKKDGRWHAIRVEVRQHTYRVRARRGYIAS